MKTIDTPIIGDFVPAAAPRNSTVPAETIASLESGEISFAQIHSDVLSPVVYARSLAAARYIRQRGIRVAYRNNYTAPRKGGQPYSYGETIVVAKGQKIPAGFKVAVANR